MKKHLLIYLIIYSICSLAGQVRAQERFADRYNITYVTMNEGLPHNFIDDLYKVVFFLFLFGYTLFDLTQTDREYSEFENKYLAQKPPFTMKAFLNNEWTQDYEEYINDQFVLRDDWITLKSVCESMLLKIENNGIAYGEDGYMFEKFTTLSGDQRAQYDRNLGYAMTFLNNHQNDNVIR